eukprot:gnl/TRDRNA2_/TRDRNA2_43251_c0_seq1.p2 gnl/TRDRNA2_/TRDRNA2_43251_c0~~gnl/TRDRNA2_/TRDRNA2_43251_c0_seq1.p2  ORF type:complete len:170 (-),score=37.23 gnl/TRDRNA2_/TRDRNA2_43251_c0_seq1:134-643(-)
MAMAAPPSIAKQVEAIAKRIRKWDTEFLCLGSKKESFSVPKPDEIVARVTANLEYFQVNYAVCLALFALIAIVVYPQLLVLVCVFSGLWYALLTRPANYKVQIGAALVTKRHMGFGLGGLNALVVLIFVRTHLFATVGAACLFVFSHATFHSVPSKAKHASEDKDENEP